MENTNNINSVNQSLLSYDISQNQLASARDLLAKYETELEILREQKDNRIVIVEKKQYNPSRNTYDTVSEMKLNVEDPNVSSTLLEIVGKVKTDELTNEIKQKEDNIKTLTAEAERWRDLIDAERKSNGKRIREVEEGKSEAIRKLKKGYEETILELEIDKETLAKSLSDLKKDKTQQHIELARQEEIDQLNDKANALQNFKVKVEELENNPIKLRKFLKSVQAVADTSVTYPWLDKMWARVYSATETVSNFVTLIKSVGRLPEKSVPTPTSTTNYPVWMYGNQPCQCDECRCDYY
jgi:hypothetical protein